MMTWGVSSAAASSSCGGSLTPSSLACSMMPGPMLLPSPLRALPRASSSRCQAGTGRAVMVCPGSRVARRVEGEEVVEGASGGVALGECLAEVPGFPECGDQRGMAVLVVEHGALRDPGGDEDRGNAVAGSVELEAELARRCIRVGRRHRSRRHMVVGSARLIPADQQGGVPDVRAGVRGARAVDVEDAFQEGFAGQHRGRRVEVPTSTLPPSERPNAGW